MVTLRLWFTWNWLTARRTDEMRKGDRIVDSGLTLFSLHFGFRAVIEAPEGASFAVRDRHMYSMEQRCGIDAQLVHDVNL